MKTAPARANHPFSVDATIDLSPDPPAPEPPVPEPGPAAPRVEVLAGQPHLSGETRCLLQLRLRAVAWIFLIAFTLYFFRSLFLPARDLVLRYGQLVVVAVLGACLVLLSRRRRPNLGRLRALELVIFGVAVAYFAVLHYRVTSLRLRAGDLVDAMAMAKRSIHSYFSVIVVYGMFIPNTWRRAAVVVGAIALVPIAVGLMFRLEHPDLVLTAGRIATFEHLSENTLAMLMGIVIAVYGTHIINALRVEAFQARQLNQYRLKHRIGAGGMGEVYLAEHQLLKRPCAIKLIRPGRATDPLALARFEREVRSTAQLSHPNTVEIYDYGRTDDGTFYYVMEYLPGLNLADLVERSGPLPPERAIHLLRQACGALAEAHAAGLVHRDLKPANIFASRRGGILDVAKLLDFGLVKPVATPAGAQLSQDGIITGSPAYMSPEQASGERAPDARSDLYSLGTVAYFLLTGRAPFDGINAIRVLIAHARDPVTPPSALRPEIPADLEAVVLRCMAKVPADRYQTAAELDRALADCAAAGLWTQDRAACWWREADRAPLTTAAV